VRQWPSRRSIYEGRKLLLVYARQKRCEVREYLQREVIAGIGECCESGSVESRRTNLRLSEAVSLWPYDQMGRVNKLCGMRPRCPKTTQREHRKCQDKETVRSERGRSRKDIREAEKILRYLSDEIQASSSNARRSLSQKQTSARPSLLEVQSSYRIVRGQRKINAASNGVRQ